MNTPTEHAPEAPQTVRGVLDFLLRSSPDIETCLLFTHDGFVIDWVGEDDREHAERAGMTCTDLFTRCGHMVNDLREGQLRQLVVRRDTQMVVIQCVNRITELVVLCKPECSLGLALTETEHAADLISPLL